MMCVAGRRSSLRPQDLILDRDQFSAGIDTTGRASRSDISVMGAQMMRAVHLT